MKAVCAALLMLFATLQAAADDCRPGAKCVLPDGEFYFALPEGWDGRSPLRTVLYFHGHRASGEQVMQHSGLVRAVTGRGYALVAPNGPAVTAGDGAIVRGWPGRPLGDAGRDDLQFVMDVMTTLAARYPVDPSRTLVTGFSAGGSMAWYLACHQAAAFAAFAPVAGALRQPGAEGGCTAEPFRLMHIHGFFDEQVPLEGRAIRDWHQGDVFASMAMARARNGCRSQPDAIEPGAFFRCRSWTSCASGADLRLCLHDRGHEMPPGWLAAVLDWFEMTGEAG